MPGRAYVDQKTCIGCGLCVSMAPQVFRLNDAGVSEVHHQEDADKEKIQQAIDSCPVNCISWR